MKHSLLFLLVVSVLLPTWNEAMSAEQIGNRRPVVIAPGTRSLYLAPGALIRLPNGSQTRIVRRLADGTLQTEEGVVITAEGNISGTEQPVVVLEPAATPSTELPALPETLPAVPGAVAAPSENTATHQPPSVPETAVAPERGVSDTTPKQDSAGAPPSAQEVPMPSAQAIVTPEAAAQKQPEQPGQLTLVELLPMTTIPQAPPKKEDEPQTTPPKKQAPDVKETPPQKEKPSPAQKAEKKEAQKPKPEAKRSTKPKVGEELSIPPDAAKTGNLDFLEGCWQGTRPEYYSKRTIRECFCFGAHGGSGKRRVIDPSGGRTCIGASSAKLGSNGVLTVKSEGAACTDGERWGQAEMVCRGKGQKTPCSWIFKDANGGRQAYEIPFIRVESCGRK